MKQITWQDDAGDVTEELVDNTTGYKKGDTEQYTVSVDHVKQIIKIEDVADVVEEVTPEPTPPVVEPVVGPVVAEPPPTNPDGSLILPPPDVPPVVPEEPVVGLSPHPLI